MATNKLTTKWSELTVSEKRNAIWKVLNLKSINFKTNIGEDKWIEFMKASKDVNFDVKADSVRNGLYAESQRTFGDSTIIAIVKRTLRIEE